MLDRNVISHLCFLSNLRRGSYYKHASHSSTLWSCLRNRACGLGLGWQLREPMGLGHVPLPRDIVYTTNPRALSGISGVGMALTKAP